MAYRFGKKLRRRSALRGDEVQQLYVCARGSSPSRARGEREDGIQPG